MENNDLQAAIALWKQYNKSNQFDAKFDEIINSGDENTQRDVFLSRLKFGTGGIRVKMGPGFGRLNDVVIIQTTQGVLRILQDQHPDLCQKGVVIGYDSRHFSRRFAELTATVFINGGVPVNLFSQCAPTPFVSFTIKLLGLSAGIMITASHNTKEYNGYKLYCSGGFQIAETVEKEISNAILNNFKPWDSSWKTDVLQNSSLLSDPLDSVIKCYCERIFSLVFDIESNIRSDMQFVYTPMHGVSYRYTKEVFDRVKLKPLIAVEEQKDPDPDFSTVKSPNPEEGAAGYALAFKTADQHNVNIILANDPDADRLGVAEKNEQTGKWRIFSGNEVGALLGWWSIYIYKNKHTNQDIFPDVYVLSTIVSSRILKTIAEAEGIQYEDTLTGFKWVGGRASELEKQGKRVLFSFEQAIGYMCDSEACPEKDGISAAVKLAELAIYLDKSGMTLSAKLDDIYSVYGYHISDDSYFICNDPIILKGIFNRLRNFNGIENNYPDSISNGRYKVIRIRDLTACYDSATADKKATLPCSLTSEMINFTFDNGFTCTIRASGTEPKIKYYVELQSSPVMNDVDVLKAIVWEMTDAILEEFLQPKINNLQRKK